MQVKVTKREARMLVESLKSKRNTLRREANYDGVTTTRRARMRLRANEMDNLMAYIEDQL